MLAYGLDDWNSLNLGTCLSGVKLHVFATSIRLVIGNMRRLDLFLN